MHKCLPPSIHDLQPPYEVFNTSVTKDTKHKDTKCKQNKISIPVTYKNIRTHSQNKNRYLIAQYQLDIQ